MEDRLPYGGLVLKYFLSKGFYVDEGMGGQAIIYRRTDELKKNPINIPTNEFVGLNYLRRIVGKINCTEEQFWDWAKRNG